MAAYLRELKKESCRLNRTLGSARVLRLPIAPAKASVNRKPCFD